RRVIVWGVVEDAQALLEEMDGLTAAGIAVDQVYVSQNAHAIMPYHRALDQAADVARIGSTGKGVGPAYADKAGRLGIRIADLLDDAVLREKLEGGLPVKNHLLRGLYGPPRLAVEELVRGVRVPAARPARPAAPPPMRR